MATTIIVDIYRKEELPIVLGDSNSMVVSLVEGSELRYSFTSGVIGHRVSEKDTLVKISDDIYIYNDSSDRITIAITRF